MGMRDLGILILRIGFCATLAFVHGLPKIVNFSTKMHTFPDPIGLGPVLTLSLMIFAELVCAVLVLLGIFTRFAVIPIIIAMAVAFFVVHAHDPLAQRELSFVYLIAFTAILALGPGKFSLDGFFRRAR